jgi:signal transduction histidine kinase
MMRSYEAAASARGNAFELVVGKCCGHVMGDKVRVHQIINNLVSNAIKYTSDGDVSVRVFRSNPLEDWVDIVVTDTGIGIPADKLDLIWQPYVRVQQDTSAAKGRGLGLAVVHRLVGLLGGSVSVCSAPGKGATFTVKLRLPPTNET